MSDIKTVGQLIAELHKGTMVKFNGQYVIGDEVIIGDEAVKTLLCNCFDDAEDNRDSPFKVVDHGDYIQVLELK